MRKPNALLLPVALLASRPLLADDCNRNGIEDALDLAATPFAFDTPQASGTPARPQQVALADMDADGDLDFLLLSRELFTITVAWNAGDGRIASLESQQLGGAPLDLAAADFDGDGLPDAAVAREVAAAILFLKNDGGGKLVEGPRLDLEVAPSRLAAFDFDGDRDADLAAIAPFAILLFRNAGQGDLASHGRTRIGSNPVALATADLDGDGHLDLASANALPDAEPFGNLSVLRNDGAGGFDAPRNLAAGQGLRAILALDLDGDGRRDLAAAGAAFQAFWNDGSGSFEPGAETAAGGPIAALAAPGAGAGGTLSLVAAVTEPASLRLLVKSGPRDFTPGKQLPLAATPLSLAAGDLDGDSREEVAVVAGILSIVRVGGDGLSQVDSLSAGSQPAAIAASDMDLDGDPDLVVADDIAGRQSAITVLGNAAGAFIAGPVAVVAGSPYRLAVLDLDGDLRGDPVVTVNEGRMVVLGNDGGTALAPRTTIGIGGNVTALAGGDVDADGRLDLLAGTENDGLVVFRQLDGGGFGERTDYAMNRRFPYSLLCTDLDGDGHLDAVSVTGDTHSLVVHWNDGRGGFAASSTLPAGSYPFEAVPLDLDGDGDLDAAVVNYGSESVTVLLNDGGRNLRSGPTLAAVRNGMALVGADFDADGKPDVAAAGDTVAVLLNDGDGLDAALPVASVDGHTVRLAAADVDGGGSPELVMAVKGFQGGGIVLFRNLARPARSADGNANGIPDECEGQVFRRGDADGNGTLNLTDAFALLGHLFLGRAEPGCREAADVDNGGSLELTDGVRILQFLFLGGPPPLPPGPPPGPCGLDPDPPGTGGDLGCERYSSCP